MALTKELLQLQKLIERNPILSNAITSLFSDEENATSIVEEIRQTLPSDDYLVTKWKALNAAFAVDTSGRLNAQRPAINDKYFYGSLYVTIMAEDQADPGESPVLIALETLMHVIGSSSHANTTHLKVEAAKVLHLGLRRLHTRELMHWTVPSDFFYNSLQILKQIEMDASLINSFINVLFIYAAQYMQMVTSLAYIDVHSPTGILAFACLATIIMKQCPEKQCVMETLFENIEHALEINGNLTQFQIGVKRSNFQQLIRQVGNGLIASANETFFAILRVAERHPKSKSLVFIINQFPYALFGRFVNVLVNLCNMSYSQHLQMFSYNLLESPYIPEQCDESEDNEDSMERLYEGVADSIIWPLQKIEKPAVTDSIKLLYAMLQIQHPLIKKIMLQMTREHAVLSDVMVYMNQFCSAKWTPNFRTMNQHYVSIYCRLLVLNEESWKHPQFAQFTSILMHASPADLHPCLSDVKALSAAPVFKLKEVQCTVMNALAHVSHDPGPHAIQILRLLHDMIFNFSSGEITYNLIALKSSRSDLVIKNMVKSKLITQKDIENLSVLCKHLRGWRLMTDLVIHMDFVLSRQIYSFSEHLQEFRADILKDRTVLFIIKFLSVILTRKARTTVVHEKETIKRFAVFLEGILIARMVPLHSLPHALVTFRKYHTLYAAPLDRLLTTHADVERATYTAFKQTIATHGNFDATPVLTRDVLYFAEMQMVFGDMPEFMSTVDTRHAVENGAQYMQNIKKRSFTQLALGMLHAMTKLSLRHEDLLETAINALCMLVKRKQPKLKQCCLDCLHDIALFRTSGYDSLLLPHVYDCLASSNPQNLIAGLEMYHRLFVKEHAIPNEWQTFLLALASTDARVLRLIDQVTRDSYAHAFAAYFETYFIHILLYANSIFDDGDHYLPPEYRAKLVPKPLETQRRRALFTCLIERFSRESRTKVLTYMYRNLADSYVRVDSTPHTLQLDLFDVTYAAFKYDADYRESSQCHYEKTLLLVKKFEHCTPKKMGAGTNADEITLLVIDKLMGYLARWSDFRHELMLKAFHVVLAILHWNYAPVFNSIVDDGINSKRAKKLLELPKLYESHRRSFQFVDYVGSDDLTSQPIQSDRV